MIDFDLGCNPANLQMRTTFSVIKPTPNDLTLIWPRQDKARLHKDKGESVMALIFAGPDRSGSSGTNAADAHITLLWSAMRGFMLLFKIKLAC
jgi:hypothetical protein